MSPNHPNPKIALAVSVAALGYFVDAYDIMLFSIIRTKSLLGIGVPPSDVFGLGVELLNWQLIGLLLGGIFWGVLGDKKGRLSVLFGSILLYSIANIANGFVRFGGSLSLASVSWPVSASRASWGRESPWFPRSCRRNPGAGARPSSPRPA